MQGFGFLVREAARILLKPTRKAEISARLRSVVYQNNVETTLCLILAL